MEIKISGNYYNVISFEVEVAEQNILKLVGGGVGRRIVVDVYNQGWFGEWTFGGYGDGDDVFMRYGDLFY